MIFNQSVLMATIIGLFIPILVLVLEFPVAFFIAVIAGILAQVFIIDADFIFPIVYLSLAVFISLLIYIILKQRKPAIARGVLYGGALIIILIMGYVFLHTLKNEEGVTGEIPIISSQELNPNDYPNIRSKLKALKPGGGRVNAEFLPNKEDNKKSITSYIIPGEENKIGFFTNSKNPREVILIDKTNNVLESFELIGEVPRYVNDIAMPTKSVILIEGSIAITKTGLFQYDYMTKNFSKILTDDLFYSFELLPFNESVSVVVYPTEKFYPGNNKEAPTYYRIRYYSTNYPMGVEVAKIKYRNDGKVTHYYWESDKIFYYLTQDRNRERLWKISVP